MGGWLVGGYERFIVVCVCVEQLVVVVTTTARETSQSFIMACVVMMRGRTGERKGLSSPSLSLSFSPSPAY